MKHRGVAFDTVWVTFCYVGSVSPIANARSNVWGNDENYPVGCRNVVETHPRQIAASQVPYHFDHDGPMLERNGCKCSSGGRDGRIFVSLGFNMDSGS